MKKLLVATVVGLLAVTAPLTAHADGLHYKGGCRISTVNDTTPGGQLGGADTWNGEVDMLVVANDAGPISATCSLRINSVNQGVILAGSGTGYVVAVGRATFRAAVTDTVTLCTNVTTNGGYESYCGFGPETPLCPVQVCGDGGVLDQVFALYDTIPETTKVLDPPLCAQLMALAPAVDALPTGGVLHIDPATGDTYLGGTTPADLIWDCPPYVTP
jgi:hypothetical protein